jgi:hypothetical protein
VAQYLNDNFVCTYLKVGAFKFIGQQKVGGNVASYFCLSDGAVLHAVAGQTDANTFFREARWAIDTRKSAQTHATDLRSGKLDMKRYTYKVKAAHFERYHDEMHTRRGDRDTIPVQMPIVATAQAKTHWLLANRPLARIEAVYPTVWQRILGEELSDLPVRK